MSNKSFYNNFIYSITPDIFKDKKLIKDSLDIYTKIIEKYSPYPNIVFFNNKSQKVVPKELVFDSYVKYIKDTLEASIANPSVISALNQQGLGSIKNDLRDNLIDLDILALSRDIKTTKGVALGIENIYKIVLNAGIQAKIPSTDIIIYEKDPEDPTAEVTPFEFYVNASMLGTLYYETVAKMSHPVGFKVNYKIEKKVPNIIENVYDFAEEFELRAESVLIWADKLELDKRIREDYNFGIDYTPKREDADQLDNKFEEDFSFEFDSTIYNKEIIELDFDDSVSQKHIMQWDLGDG